MPPRNCCVPGCAFKGNERFRLPHPRKEETMLRKWITIIGGELCNMSLENIYNKKRICKSHFIDNYFNPGCKGLLRTALPSLCLPRDKRTYDDAFLESDPMLQPSTSKNSPSKKKIATSHMHVVLPIINIEQDQCYYNRVEAVTLNSEVQMTPVLDSPKTPTKNKINGADIMVEEVNVTTSATNAPKTPTKKPMSAKTSQGFLQGVGVTRATHLSPKASYLYSAANSLKRKVQHLHKKCRGFKSRLAAAFKLTEDEAFQKVTKNMT